MTLSALTLSLHLASVHFGGGDWNEQNVGIGINYAGYHVGTYRNSMDRQSVYAGRSLTRCAGPWCAGGALMIVTGYSDGPIIAPVPIVSIGNGYRVQLIGTPSIAGVAGFIGASVEVPVRGWR